jgi:alpha-tubulin suppressor-like RCC1 family protein
MVQTHKFPILRKLRSFLYVGLLLAVPFVAMGAPFAHTQPATLITPTNATLNGMVVPNGPAVTVWFEWGSLGGFDQRTGPIAITAGSNIVRVVSAGISGITNGGVYQCRLVASNSMGVANGFVQLFTTGKRVTAWGDNLYGQTRLPAGLSNVVAVAAGRIHGLALKADGNVIGWGNNSFGETNIPTTLSNVVTIAGGFHFSLALKSDGRVTVWGGNFYGVTNVPSAVSNVIALATLDTHILALRSNGTVVAWGRNDDGQCNVPSGLSNVVSLAAGSRSSLALKADGTVTAWGLNKDSVPAGLTNIVALTCGSTMNGYTLAVKADGTVVAWGDNFYGQTDVPAGLSNVVAVAGGYGNSLALKSNGTVVTWGYSTNVPIYLTNVVAVVAGNSHYIAIVPNSAPRALPQTASGAVNRDLVVVLNGFDLNGDALAFRIKSLPLTGQLYQYADGVRGTAIADPETPIIDLNGRLIFVPETNGYGSPYASFTFTANDGDSESAPATITAAIGLPQVFTLPPTAMRSSSASINGMVVPNGFPSVAWFEWGERQGVTNTTGPVDVGDGTQVVYLSEPVNSLGNGGTYHCRLVVSNETGVAYGRMQLFTTGKKVVAWGQNYGGQTNPPAGLSNIVAVSGGGWNALVLRNDGTITAWGDNSYGTTNIPVGLSNVVAIAAGGGFNLALKADGSVVAFGSPYGGVTNVPAGLSNVVAVAAGDMHSLALKANGTVVAWGDDYYGQVSGMPPNLSNVVAVAGGDQHSLALKSDGTVVAWGAGGWDFGGPAAVPAGLSQCIDIAGGREHSIALKADGTVVAWGNNDYGQTNVPSGLSNVFAISSGYYHNLALAGYESLEAWGYNLYGQADVPPGLSNVVAAAAGGFFNVLLVDNLQPVAQSLIITNYPNCDSIIQLRGSDANGDSLNYRVASLPAAGTLFQYDSGSRGVQILTQDTMVTDALGRIIFVPAANTLGSPYATCSYVANDGEADSAPATATINVVLPSAPQISASQSNWKTNGQFELNFTGRSNAIYRVWASTNLVNWDVLGTAITTSNGWFQFLDFDATNWPQRFYRAGAP